MYKSLLTLSIIIISLQSVCASKFTVLQLNLWAECTKVPYGVEALTDQIAGLKPDVAAFCELYKGAGDDPVLPKLIAGLKRRNLHYYSARIDGRAIISKYPIVEQQRINKWQFKAVLNVNGQRVAVYPAHSEYRYYTCYYPRGYNDGSNDWDKLERPITDVDTILKVCNQSGRIESAQAFIDDAKAEICKGSLIVYAGDFNEPSHLDWQENTASKFDHNGCVVNWGVSSLLYANGFRDAYRQKYPDAANYPGFTFPADNRHVDPSAITWAPDADERERIDFVYYYPDGRWDLKHAQLFGPGGCIVKGKRTEDESKDEIIAPRNDRWPSDHRAVFATFEIKL